jgi:myxalamid-type polyketide synthase MxaE and MxaD
VGLLSAEWLAGHGARSLVLTGLHEPDPEGEAAQRISTLRENGAAVHAVIADIGKRSELAAVFMRIAAEMPPLRGIINSAVVLSDSTLAKLDPDQFFKVMAPKVDGSWLLHEMSQDLPLDFFLLYSSVGSLIGLPGQGNYAAANAYQDGLAHYRKLAGLPALSINWGQWHNTGQTSRLGNLSLTERGLPAFAAQDAFAMLDRLLASPPAQIGVLSFDPGRWMRYFPALRGCSLFADLGSADAADDADHLPIPKLQLLPDGSEPSSAQQTIQDYLCALIAAVTGLPADRIDGTQRLDRLGIDSLLSLQLRNRIRHDLGLEIPVTILLQQRSISQVAISIHTQLGQQAGAGTGIPGASAGREP